MQSALLDVTTAIRFFAQRKAAFAVRLYYLLEIWWKKMLFPNSTQVSPSRRVYRWDSILATAGSAFIIVCIVLVARVAGRSVLEAIIAGWVWPFLVWNWLMGFVIYQHHTHPSIAWFNDVDEWRYCESQVEGTTHIRFPRVVNLVLHNIMEHTAHHALTGIPLYHLRQAQGRLESELRAAIVVQKWTLGSYMRTLRACKLYDYRRRCWLNFDGHATSRSMVD
jgi:omega-6 fatty acid desaturase (delta-12 desaturase)